MKTPLEEVFAHLRASKENDSFGEVYCVDWLLENEKSLLEKEKEVIMNAYKQGVVDEYGDTLDSRTITEAEDYYNDIFNTKDK